MRTLLSTVLVRNPFLTKRQTPLDIPLLSYHIYPLPLLSIYDRYPLICFIITPTNNTIDY
jgi:hypothetical protein